MPDAPVLGGSKKVKLDERAFTARFNEPLVHQSVRAEQAARRRGTAATKTRGMVSGGSAKPWRQKGTGRARAGSSRSPIWTGGGTVFGPQPRSYTFKVNRKEQRAALRSALSLHAERGSLAVLDTAAFTEPKTARARDLLEGWQLPGGAEPTPTLVALAPEERDAALSFRNINRVAVLSHENVGVADLLAAASLLLSQQALDALSARANAERVVPEAATANTAAKASRAKQPADQAPAEVDSQAAQTDQQTAPEPDTESEPAEEESS